VRRLIVALSAVLLSVGLALAISLTVSGFPEAVSEEPTDSAQDAQYQDEVPGNTEPPQEDPPPNAEEPDVRVPEAGDGPSEGSIPGARAPAEEISAMEPDKPYSQVVDNDSKQRFSARGWKERDEGSQHRGKNYSFVRPEKEATHARYRVKIPSTGEYTFYARWPAAKRNNTATRIGVNAAPGVRWTKVNQRRDGDMWTRLGAYRMEAGNDYAVRVSGRSKTEGRVVADAIMVVKGTQTTLPGEDAASGKTLGEGATGQEVVQEARTHIGTPYRHSPPEPCQAYKSEDCSCLTSVVFDRLELPDHPVEQWKYGEKVEGGDLRPGDLVFFKEGGSSVITHVGIYSGNGNIVHSSSYWGHVVEREMKYVDGYVGARRLTG
jgi:cell wall-associated NlpC family hydrolase